ncbi:hypothetical protein GF322_03030 [Candidatus Dependentiae bacterium]|nr:hypothetical protein [Candidatus Dependentiae bacterium]
MKISIFDEKIIKPLEGFGLTHPFWHMHIETLRNTWIAMSILFVLVLIANYFLRKKINIVAIVYEKAVEFFNDLCKESFGKKFRYEYFSFVSTIFFFTLAGCLIGLLPFCDESTKDLNTTLALGSLSFFYVQYQKIKIHGFIAFLKEFTEPFIVLLPLNIIGELAKVASMSFRLFGNILGGAIIYLIIINALEPYKIYFIIFSLAGLFIYWIATKIINLEKHYFANWFLKFILIIVFFLAGTQIFFGIFEGIVQSFVITMLTITYLAVAIQEENDDEEELIIA